MLGSNTGRVRKLTERVSIGLAAIVIAACAASSTMRTSGPESTSIADVRIERSGNATIVTLLGVEEPVFTAFAQQDPDRLVVDLASVAPDALVEPIAVHDGLVEEVALAPYATGTGDAMTRIELSLAVPADYEVTPSSEGLVIRVEPLGGLLGSDLPETESFASEPDPWAIVPSEGEPAPPVAATPATQLLGIETRQVGDGSIIQLKADGMVMSAESFTLENPDRLVIDLAGLANGMESKRLETGMSHAKQVRIGEHADKVRVVIDAGETSDPFQGRRVIPTANGLVVALGAGQDLDSAVEEMVDATQTAMATAPALPSETDQALADATSDAWETPGETGAEDPEADGWASTPAAPAPAAETEPQAQPSGSEGPVTIFGVEFDAQATRDRVVVLGERPVDYLLYEPSPDTVIVSIQHAVIDPEAAVRIQPEPGGPVSLVTTFEQPEIEGGEVRVVIQRAPDLKPEISRRGSLVVIDFPRDGSVAAVPPALAGTAAAPSKPGQAAASHAAGTPAAQKAIASGGPMPVAQAAAPASVASIDVLREGGFLDDKEYIGRRISLDFKDIEMADVLRLIAEVSDLNVIAGDEVQGRVTIRLVDVPWDQALDVILLTKGLGFVRVGNVLRIAPSELLKQEEEMRLQERRALEQLEDLVVKLQPVNYANVTDVRGMVSRLLSQRGTVDVDKRTNTLIIKDIPSVVDEATALIKAIDTQTPQVLIESKIVEANLDFAREFGVTWGVGAQPLVDAFDPSSASRTDLGSDAFRLNTTNSALGNNATFINPLTAGPTALFNLAGFILDEKINLELQLQAAEINGDGKVVSSPRVVTVDNGQATIEQGVSIPFQTFENGDAQLEFVDAVLKLDVTPHITADRSIIMKVKVSRNAPDDSVFTLTGSPAIAKNQVDTETLVKDGQTLVIGGIYVVDQSQRQSRVPYLHSLPLLGSLFRSDEISDSRKELLIFVTPRVVAAAPSGS